MKNRNLWKINLSKRFEDCKVNSRNFIIKCIDLISWVWFVNYIGDFLESLLFWAWTSKRIEILYCAGHRLPINLVRVILVSPFLPIPLS